MPGGLERQPERGHAASVKRWKSSHHVVAEAEADGKQAGHPGGLRWDPHLPEIIHRERNGKEGHEDDGHGVLNVILRDPQADAEELEGVKWIEDLGVESESHLASSGAPAPSHSISQEIADPCPPRVFPEPSAYQEGAGSGGDS